MYEADHRRRVSGKADVGRGTVRPCAGHALRSGAGFPAGKRCYYHLEAFTRAEELAAPELFPEDTVIISREVGSGVVPMDAAERAWRERHGALLQQLSRRSETVIRIFCGLPQQLKP